MKPETQQILFDRYPDIFREKGLPSTETCMCWGIECSDGWFDLLDKLCGQLTLLKRYTGMEVVAMQVKEKFGTLRFYWRMDTFPIDSTHEQQKHWWNIVEALVDRAQNESAQTCEITGESGVLCLNGGWYKTLCAEEAKKSGYVTVAEWKRLTAKEES